MNLFDLLLICVAAVVKKNKDERVLRYTKVAMLFIIFH